MRVRDPAANRFVRVFLWGALAVILLAYGLLYALTVPVLEARVAQLVAQDLEVLRAQYNNNGINGLKELIDERLAYGLEANSYYLLKSPTGDIVAGNLEQWPPTIVPDGKWRQINIIHPPKIDSLPVGVRAIALPNRYLLLAGRDLELSVIFRKRVTEALTIALVLTVLIGLIGSYVLSRFLLRRVEAIADAAEDIMRGDLSRRIKILGDADEFEALSRTLNAMLDRIEDLMTSMRAITDGIAHDFRSTLMRLKARLESTLTDHHSEADYRNALTTVRQETEELLRALNSLLEIARAEAGLGRDQMTSLDLAALVRDLGELYLPLAEEKSLKLTIKANEPVNVRGQQQLLAQAIANLLENALKYSPPGSEITLKAAMGPAGPVLLVADQGPGVPEEDRLRVLERFVRLENAPSTPGAGLGLSLVNAVAKLHGATFSLADNDPGLRATIRFNSRPRR